MTSLTPLLRIPTRRNTELVLLVFAVLVVVGAEAAVEAAPDGPLSPPAAPPPRRGARVGGGGRGPFSAGSAPAGAVPLVAGVITPLVIRKFARYADPLMLP